MKKMLVAVLLMLLLFACGKKQDNAKNMEQIQNEEGIPVRQTIVEPSTFLQELTYNATLSGSEESTASAMVSDIITKINAKVGDRVQKDQIIISFPANTPAAQFEQATSAFNSIRTVYERMKRLHDQGAISRQDLDNVETQYQVSKANLAASEQMINVRAPISGIITAMLVNPSEKVFPGKDLFTVASTNGYKAAIMVPESEIGKIKKGMKATATSLEETINGKVSDISLAMDMDSKAFRVEVMFPGINKKINYGVTAEVNIVILSKPNTIVVQREHLVYENGDKYVWLNIGDKAVKTPVVTGLDSSLEFEITSGLNSGDVLITEGINMLNENAKLRVID
ncbi:MAG: efflux RND transporter periplasmic adaptor subunit [Candidatus Cloacimonetes bacterium HGW-Cloacimonetes-3]|nr:MAG: efflux RND transporter periplasmic adaptor subunit [Candidatus Cloacimonetes bacterium HGW-Cloacimonetes-3]